MNRGEDLFQKFLEAAQKNIPFDVFAKSDVNCCNFVM